MDVQLPVINLRIREYVVTGMITTQFCYAGKHASNKTLVVLVADVFVAFILRQGNLICMLAIGAVD